MNYVLERTSKEAGAQREVPSQPVHERTKEEYEKQQQGHSVLHPSSNQVFSKHKPQALLLRPTSLVLNF